MEKFRQGVFASKKVKTKNEEGEVTGEESQPSPVIPLWKEAVKECTTFSRMHVLLGNYACPLLSRPFIIRVHASLYYETVTYT